MLFKCLVLQDYGFSRMGASEAPAIAHRLPGYMDPPGIGLRPSVPVEKKWALGLQVITCLSCLSLDYY